MYISVQFIILEILVGLIFLAVLYFMLRDLLKKIVRKELQETKEHVKVLAEYLVQLNEQYEEDGLSADQNVLPSGAAQQVPAQNASAEVGVSPEKLVMQPVDVADEFVALKNANRINAYNLRVQEIWELYKNKKITIKQYNEELIRLKKAYGIALDESDKEKADAKTTVLTKIKPLTQTVDPKQRAEQRSASDKDRESKEAAANATGEIEPTDEALPDSGQKESKI